MSFSSRLLNDNLLSIYCASENVMVLTDTKMISTYFLPSQTSQSGRYLVLKHRVCYGLDDSFEGKMEQYRLDARSIS